MKKILPLVFFCLAFFTFNAGAQTTVTCNANFTFTVSGQTVKFLPDVSERSTSIINYWTFGDGHTSDSIAPYNTFPLTGGVFIVTHYQIRKNPNGVQLCIDSVKKEVNIPAACLDPTFTYLQNTTNYLSIQFTNTTALFNANDSVSWMFGDGTHSGDINATHVYANAGTYHVCLLIKRRSTASGANSCTREKCLDVVVTQPCNLQANFNFQKDPLTNKVYFVNASTPASTADSTRWSFGDGTYSNDKNPTHTYTQAGTYTVCLSVKRNDTNTGAIHCSDSTCKTVEIVAPDCSSIVPDFTWLANATLTTKVTFTNTTTGLIATDSVRWSFGDGTYSKDISPSHTYTLAGTYNVTMQVLRYTPGSIQVLCERTITKEIKVALNCSTVSISFDYKSDSAIGNPYKYTFTNSTSTINNTDSIRWTFGDGGEFNNVNPTHTYANAGTYTVCLRVIKRDNNHQLTDCVKEICKTIVITAPCDFTSGFTAIASTSSNKVINFTATSNLPTNTISTADVRWIFGDGTTTPVTGWTATHTYANPGKYYVCVRIQTSTNCVKYKCDSITVIDNPIPCDFTASYTAKADSINKKKINFVASSTLPSGTTATATWFFGDNTSATGFNATHEYAQPGRYYVCVKVQTNSTCYKYTCDSITVLDNIISCDFVAGYAVKADSVNHKKIVFTNTTVLASNPNTHATWSFGDGSANATTWDAMHEYAQPGKYKVCLIVYNGTATNCVKYTCDSITVHDNVIPCDFVAGYTTKADSVNTKKITFAATATPISTSVNILVTWSFGDGSAGVNGWTATHEYAQPGKYYVCARIQYGANCVKYKCDSVTVTAPPPPCDFTPNFTWAKDGNTQKINFTNTTTFITANANSTATWFFGDNSAGVTGWNATHEYAQPGRYYVCVRVQYSTTCVKYKCDSITVVAPTIPCDFVPGYTWVKDATNSKKINFTNTTALSTTSNVSATWSFGDGTATVTSWNAIHEFAQPGKYYVCLRVAYGTNCVKYKCDSVTVTVPPVPCTQLSLFTSAPSSVNNQLYYFTPVNQSGDVQYTWTYGDGTGSHDMISNHQFANNQTYNVCLTAFKNATCASTTCKEIRVATPVNCDTIKVSYGYRADQYMQNKIYFYAVSNVYLQNQTWTIVKVGASTTTAVTINQNNPMYNFTDTGYYNVCLRTTTANGCVKETCGTIHIESIATACELQAFPNPATTQVNVYVSMDNSETIHAYLYNVQTVLLQQKDQQGFPGNNVVSINTGSLPQGYYTIKLIYGNKVCFAKFQKL